MSQANPPIPAVRDHMTRTVFEVRCQSSLRAAIETMLKRRIHHLCVMDGPDIVGILSDRDVTRALPSPLLGFGWSDYDAALDSISAGQAMTRKPVTVSPDTPMNTAAQILLERGIHALPVLERGRVVGILSERDCMRHYVAVLGDPFGDTDIRFGVDDGPALAHLLACGVEAAPTS